MKNYIYRLSCLALMGLALTACNDDGFDSPRPSKNNKKGINFTVESFVPESITRMAYDETATGDLIPTLTANDIIAVWGMRNGLTEKVQFLLEADNINADGSANFDGGLWRLRSDETRYAAFYPYNGPNCDGEMNWDTNEFTYCQWVNYDDQWYDASLDAYASLGNYDYLFCAAQQADEEGNVNFAMQHVGAVVSAHLYGLPAGADVRSLTVSLPGEDFDSQGKILMEGTDITIADPQKTKSLTINCGNLYVAEAGDVYVYFMCPPVDLTNKEITFRVNVGGMLYKGTNIYTSNKDVVAGSYKKLSCKNLAMSGTAVTLGEDTPVQEGESYYFIPAEDGVYALSADANCWFEAPQIYDPQTGEYYPYLRKDQVYPVMYYDWDVPSSFVVTQKDFAILPLGEEYTVEEGKCYLLSIAKNDLYEFTSPDGAVTHMMGSWDFPLPYCEYFSEGFGFVYFDASGTVKISKPQVAELTLDEPVTVTAGTVYKLSITEEGPYQFESENGNNLCYIKQQYSSFWMPQSMSMPIGDWYVSFDNDDVVKISKLSYFDLPLNETVQVVAGQIYKMDVTEDGYYQFEGTPGMNNLVNIINFGGINMPNGLILNPQTYYVKFDNDDEVKVSQLQIVDFTLGKEVDVVPGTAYRYNTRDFYGYVRLSGSEGVTHCQSNYWNTVGSLPFDVEVGQWYDCFFTFDEMGKFMISEVTYESLPATGTVTVTAGATYTYQCDESGMYTFASAKAGNKVNVLNWGDYEYDLPFYQIFNPGEVNRLRFAESDEITITKVEDEALQIGQNNVADGKWYSFTASEDFECFVSFENFGYDWSSIGPGYQYYYGGSTNYIHITEATADAAITITPADDVYQTAIAVEPGTEYGLVEGRWYSIYIEAYRNIQLDETLDNAIRGVMMYSDYGSFELSADWSNSYWAPTTWYFQAPSSGKIKFDYVD